MGKEGDISSRESERCQRLSTFCLKSNSKSLSLSPHTSTFSYFPCNMSIVTVRQQMLELQYIKRNCLTLLNVFSSCNRIVIFHYSYSFYILLYTHTHTLTEDRIISGPCTGNFSICHSPSNLCRRHSTVWPSLHTDTYQRKDNPTPHFPNINNSTVDTDAACDAGLCSTRFQWETGWSLSGRLQSSSVWIVTLKYTVITISGSLMLLLLWLALAWSYSLVISLRLGIIFCVGSAGSFTINSATRAKYRCPTCCFIYSQWWETNAGNRNDLKL